MKLYVEKSIEIDASPSSVWNVLTRPEFTRQWAGEFGAEGPIDSTWKLGSRVLWRNAKGEVYVQGSVTALDQDKLLRFTVCDVGTELRPVSGLDEDEITQTYALSGQAGRTLLSTAHGDFGKLANAEKIHPLVVALWDRLLPRLKEIAELASRSSGAEPSTRPGRQ